MYLNMALLLSCWLLLTRLGSDAFGKSLAFKICIKSVSELFISELFQDSIKVLQVCIKFYVRQSCLLYNNLRFRNSARHV